MRQTGHRDIESAAEREDRQRASFAPHLWVIAERKIPSPVFVVAVCGTDAFLRVPLPEGIATLTDVEQEQMVCRTAARHFLDTRGTAGPFGKIVGYVYRQSFDVGWTLSVDGQVIDRNAPPIVVGEAELFLKNRRIDQLFRQRLNESNCD